MILKNFSKNIIKKLEKDNYVYSWKETVDDNKVILSSVEYLFNMTFNLSIVLDNNVRQSLALYKFLIESDKYSLKKKEEIIYEISRILPEGYSCTFKDNYFIVSTNQYPFEEETLYNDDQYVFSIEEIKKVSSYLVKAIELLTDTIESKQFVDIYNRYFK